MSDQPRRPTSNEVLVEVERCAQHLTFVQYNLLQGVQVNIW
jgi:hypothetical protein